MMSELTRLHEEATRLLTLYGEYKNSKDDFMRRKVSVDLDRFLMENRETAALLLVQGLQAELEQLTLEAASKRRKGLTKQSMLPEWYRRLKLRRSAKGGAKLDEPSTTTDA